ncbi:MAG: helix-turn-helix domain-containing protein [Candidatus Bathyarchaeia archaeon]
MPGEITQEDALQFLGLKQREARTYLTLVNLLEADAQTIADKAGISRQDIYRILLALRKLGLLEVHVGNPTKFRITPAQHGIGELLKSKVDQFSIIVDRITNLMNKINVSQDQKFQEKCNFKLTDSKKSSFNIRKKAIENLKVCLDINTTSKRLCQLWSYFDKEFIAAMNRGVRLRFIVPYTKSELPLHDLFRSTDFSLMTIRFTDKLPTSVFAIFDKKDLYYVLEYEKDLLSSPLFYTNEPTIVSAMNDYFEKLWKDARPIPEHNDIPQFTKSHMGK